LDTKPVQLDADELIEQLYNLDRKDIRKVAFEALLISDGPDHIDGDVKESAYPVGLGTILAEDSGDDLEHTLFTIWGPKVTT
jgi:hypothetical protein